MPPTSGGFVHDPDPGLFPPVGRQVPADRGERLVAIARNLEDRNSPNPELDPRRVAGPSADPEGQPGGVHREGRARQGAYRTIPLNVAGLRARLVLELLECADPAVALDQSTQHLQTSTLGPAVPLTSPSCRNGAGGRFGRGQPAAAGAGCDAGG